MDKEAAGSGGRELISFLIIGDVYRGRFISWVFPITIGGELAPNTTIGAGLFHGFSLSQLEENPPLLLQLLIESLPKPPQT